MKDDLSILAGLLFFAGLARYGWAVWRDRKNPKASKPIKVSWLIWISVDCISLAGMWARDALNGQIVGTVIGGIVVLILALFFGKPGWTKLDKFVLAGAVLGLLLWGAFDSPELGILMSGFLVLIGSIPTIRSAIENPSHEDRIAWTLYFVSCIFALLAVPRWDTLADTIQPVTFTIIETVMVIILYAPRRK